MKKESPLCPECGDPLVVSVLKDPRTDKMTITFYCEGAGDDLFAFDIETGITNKDISNLREEGKRIKKEMNIRLVERKSEREVLDSIGKDSLKR